MAWCFHSWKLGGVFRTEDGSWHQWLTPVILATQEAEIRRTAVRSQPRQIVLNTLFEKPFTKKVWWSDSRCRS
jgi:hypothetical protein